jgi:GEVED domain/Fibronectin type III domain/Secretion system C-terminal sorting domain/Photosynthesis system II assembly factor YCF48
MKKIYLLLFYLLLGQMSLFSQSIAELMQRTDLPLQEIKMKAQKYFDSAGTGRGTGYKIFQRWLYERQFHVDKNGFYVDPNVEAARFNNANANIVARSTATNWTEMGPYNYAQGAGWNPGTGRVNAMAIDKNNENLIYVATPAGGIWKTTNGGANWQALTDNNTLTIEVYALAMNPQNSNTVYAATNNGGLWRTNDAGQTWNHLVNTATFGNLKGILINPNDTNNIITVGSNKVFRTVNGGNSWVNTSSAGIRLEDIVFHPTNSNIVYTCGYNVLKSNDNGQSWSLISTAQGMTYNHRMRLAVTPANPDLVYAIQATDIPSGSNFNKLFRSTNAGSSFTTMVTGNPANGTNYFGYETNGTGTVGQAWHDMAICASPTNANEVDIAGIICWKSTNGGTAFTCKTSWDVPTTFGYNHADVHNLYWVNNNMYATTDGGIYKSMDGGNSWIDISTGLGIQQIYRVASSHNFATPLTVGAQDNGSTVLTPTGWKSWLGADGMEGAISNSNPQRMWGTSQGGFLYRSDDGGQTKINIGRPNGGNWVTPIAVHPTDDNIVYGGWTGFFKYNNATNTFTNLTQGVFSALITDFAISKSDPNRIYVVINGQGQNTSTYIYKTINGGITWSLVPNPRDPQLSYSFDYEINDIAISPSDPDKYWIATAVGVFSSYDGGANYRELDYSIPTPVRSVVIDDLPSQGVYASAGGYVYYHDLNDTTWVNYSANLPKVAINELDINYAAGKLRAAFYGRGIWELPIETSNNICTAPTGLSISNITSTTADATWNTIANIMDYTVEIRPVGGVWQIIGTPTNNVFNFTSLISSTTYEWRVRSNCSATNSSTYTQDQFTTATPPCNAPNGLNTSNITTNSAVLNWQAVSGAVDYTVEYRTANGNWILANTTTSTSYALPALQSSTTYEWRVRANCSATNSSTYTQDQFTTATPPCNAPTGLNTSNITTNSAVLNWQTVSGALDYTVEYRTANGNWTLVTTTTSTSYTLPALQSSTSYEWRVRANCSATNSSAYAQDQFTTATPPCNAPTGLTTSNITTNSAVLNWQAVSGVVNYTVEYRTANGNWILANTTTSTSYALPALQSSTTYEWRVRSNCSATNSSTYVQSQFTTLSIIVGCSTPTSITVSNVQSNSATINWTAVTGGSSYNLQYRKLNDVNWITITNITNPFYTITNLLNNTTYQYRIATVCGSNTSSYSSIQQFTSACTSSGINTNEWISYFSMGAITRTSGADMGGYIATGMQTNLTIGSTNIVQVRAGYANGNLKDNFAIYMDLDRNGDFNGANERIFGLSLINNSNLRTYNVTVPATALPGLTAMRIILLRQAAGITVIPCLTGYPGETEDYVVNLTLPNGVPSTSVTDYTNIISNKKALLVTPNPASTNLSFTWNNQTERYSYLLIDANGKTILTGNGTKNNRNNLTVTKLVSGTYYIKVFTTKGDFEIKKVVIHH